MSHAEVTYPPGTPLTVSTNRLRAKLRQVDVEALAISDYARTYLKGVLANNTARLAVYEHLLSLAFPNGMVEGTLVIDHGGGNGLLSLLAKEIRLRVIYSDINQEATEGARALGEALGLPADHYVTGDTADLADYIREHRLFPRALISNDVIEHVYDQTEFLRSIAAMLPPSPVSVPFTIVMGSEANGANPRIRRRTIAMQKAVETQDRQRGPGHRTLDSLRSYRSLRADIIRASMPTAHPTLVDQLAEWTRGMNQRDIERAVEEYPKRGLPTRLTHPTNTCDPITGNWAERLMDPRSLVATLEALGFRSRVVPGLYAPNTGAKGIIARALDVPIRILGRLALPVSPYYVVVGHRR